MPRTDLIYFMGGPNNMSHQICEQHGRLTETELCFSKIQLWIYLMLTEFFSWIINHCDLLRWQFSTVAGGVFQNSIKHGCPDVEIWGAMEWNSVLFFFFLSAFVWGWWYVVAHVWHPHSPTYDMLLHMYGIHTLPHHLVQMTAHFAYGNYCTAHWHSQTFWLCALTKGCLQSKEFMKIVPYSK